jgi:hypothetical protein
MLIIRTSIHSGITRSMDLPVTELQLDAYERGSLLQEAFPNLDADQREFIKTGITKEEWVEIYGPDED